METARAGAYEGVVTSVSGLQASATKLSGATLELSTALRSTGVQGQWGQVELERLFELAGLTEGVSYERQKKEKDGVPDIIIRLTGGGVLPVDAKATITHYLAAAEAADENEKKRHLALNAKYLRDRVRELVGREYWKNYGQSPECTIMFVPSEASLTAAFREQPDLFDYALGERVLITSPVSLLALLKAVAFGWQQQNIAEHVGQIRELCQEFYERLIPFFEHLDKVGKSLDEAVKAHNKGVGSLQHEVLPQGRKLRELGIGTEELQDPKQPDTAIRELKSPERGLGAPPRGGVEA